MIQDQKSNDVNKMLLDIHEEVNLRFSNNSHRESPNRLNSRTSELSSSYEKEKNHYDEARQGSANSSQNTSSKSSI